MSEKISNNFEEQPPFLSPGEAAAVIGAQTQIANGRITNTEGVPKYDEMCMGITADGIFVSVERPNYRYSEGQDSSYKLSFGSISKMSLGSPVTEVITADSSRGLHFRGAPAPGKDVPMGHTKIDSGFGDILVFTGGKFERFNSSPYDLLPTFAGKKLFPIGPDGQPYIPIDELATSAEDKTQAPTPTSEITPSSEVIAIEPTSEEVSAKGLRRFFRRS